MTCRHRTLKFETRFALTNGGQDRMFQVTGYCAECGAEMLFEPRPTLTTDDKTFQIPFRMGPPDRAHLEAKRAGTRVIPMVIGAPSKGMN